MMFRLDWEVWGSGEMFGGLGENEVSNYQTQRASYIPIRNLLYSLVPGGVNCVVSMQQ